MQVYSQPTTRAVRYSAPGMSRMSHMTAQRMRRPAESSSQSSIMASITATLRTLDASAVRGLATLALFATLLVAALAPTIVGRAAAPTTNAAAMNEQVAAGVTGLYYRRGYTIEGSWLCYGWASGSYHCTQRWYRAASGALVSLNTAWVPNYGAAATAANVTNYAPLAAPTPPKGLSQWAYTGLAAYTEPWGVHQGYSWGWCTSGAALLAHNWVGGLGNAIDWTRNAAARGMATGYTPRVGATVVYQPGVQGASGGGHVGHVYAVYANGWFISEDANFSWNGGGFGRISFRYAHAGPGVSFIY